MRSTRRVATQVRKHNTGALFFLYTKFKRTFCFLVYLDLKGPPNDGCGGESQPCAAQHNKRTY
jgi:hypothetical protein